MTKLKVVITDLVNDELEIEKQVVGDLADVIPANASCEAELVGKIEDADAVLQYRLSLSAETLDRLRQCRIIVRGGVGYDNVDYVHARRLGIPVANVPDYGTEEVADSAIGLTLALTRGIAFHLSSLRLGLTQWSDREAKPLRRLRGRVFGVVGLGRIGTAAALRAKAFGLRVVFYDPYKPRGYDKTLGAEQAETLEDLVRQSYVLSLHCPLTQETQGMIDKRLISLLPRGAFIVNTARGGILDTRVLPEALESGALAGVGIDVFETEPPPDDDPLVSAWKDPGHPAYYRAVLNPHSAYFSEDSFKDLRRKAALTCRRALAGQPLYNIVN